MSRRQACLRQIGRCWLEEIAPTVAGHVKCLSGQSPQWGPFFLAAVRRGGWAVMVYPLARAAIKMTTNWLLKTTEMCAVTILKSETKVLVGRAPAAGSREEPFLVSSALLAPESSAPLACSCLSHFLPVFTGLSPVSVCPPILEEHQLVHVGSTHMIASQSFLTPSAESPFPNEVAS